MAGIHAATALLPTGWASSVGVEIGPDGRIGSVSIGANASADALRVPVLLPAMPNLHSHSFQRAMAGLSESRGPKADDSFWTWRDVMYRFLDVLSPDDIEAIAAFAFMEMQENGFGSVAEFHYLHHGPNGVPYADRAELSSRIAAAAEAAGIGLTLLPVHYAQGGVDGRPLAGGQLRFGNDLDGFIRLAKACEATLDALPDDAGFGLAPHSLRAVPFADMSAIAALGADRPIHLHIAEQEREIEETLAILGARPVEWLLANAEVGPNWCAIHATHMTPEETAALAASGAVAGLCPLTEGSLGDGIFPMPGFRASGGSFGIGTDSNILISVPGELRQLEYSQRLRDRRRVVVASRAASNGRMLYEEALAGGARALGRACGRIETGCWADLVAINPERMDFHGLVGDRILDAWLLAARDGMVTDLWSAGRHAVRDGQHVGRERIGARYERSLRGILERF